jgi:hypothetical protein
LECPTALVLSLVDLAMRMQSSERVVADRSHRNDLLARLKGQRIIDLHGGHFSVQRQIPSPPIMYFRQSV